MIISKTYKIMAKIKTHTRPLSVLIYERVGTLIKETKSFFVFDTFRVNKANVLHAQEVVV